MADDKEALFTVNAGQILAKLHLAARQDSEHDIFYAFNTGIKDETKDDTPEKPGKAIFDLTNKSGEYEVCFVTRAPIEYNPQIVLSAMPSVSKDLEKYNSLKEKLEKDKEADKKKGATDAPNPNILKSEEELKKLKTKIFNEIKKTGVKLEDDDTFEEANKKVDEENKLRKDRQDDNMSKYNKKDVAKYINEYFKTFSGKDAKTVKEDQLVQLQFDDANLKSRQPTIEDYKIFGMDEKQIEEWNKSILKDLSKKVQLNIGYKVGFNVEVETM